MDLNKEFERPAWWYQPDERSFENVDYDDGKMHFSDFGAKIEAEIEATERMLKLLREKGSKK